MGRKLDLTGQKFGRLTVIRKNGKQGKCIMWECKCECGNVKTIRSSHLRSGATQSCGCLSREKARNTMRRIGAKSPTRSAEKLLTGRKFGRLLVLRDSGERTNRNNRVYECECECGNIVYVPAYSLKNNHTQSCGCLLKEIAKKKAQDYLKSAKKNDLKEGTSLWGISLKKNQKNNTSGVTGVWLDKRSGKWIAELTLKGEVFRLGTFKDKQVATNVRKEAEEKYFSPIIEKYR